MVYNPNLRNINYNNSFNKSSYSTPSVSSLYGRVLHVVLSKDDDYYEDTRSLYSILYKPVKLDQINSNEDFNLRDSSRAYLFNSQVVRIPLVDEIVQIVKGPGATLTDTPFSEDDYYTFPVNIFNDIVQSGSPRVDETGIIARKGIGIDSIPSINKLNLNQGDILFQGRLGQSLRFSGFPGKTSDFVDESNKSKPLTILKNGRSSEGNFKELISENVNLDDSSIYLTSDHKIPINLSRKKFSSFFSKEDIPILPSEFKGRQIVVDSGRLVMNAKDNDIVLSSQNSTSITSDTINLDGEIYIGIDAPRIYLGTKSFTENHPIVLGGRNEEWVNKLLDLLSELLVTLSSLPPSSAGIASTLATKGLSLITELEAHRKDLPNIKSKKTFTE